jgi:hypothetical protein
VAYAAWWWCRRAHQPPTKNPEPSLVTVHACVHPRSPLAAVWEAVSRMQCVSFQGLTSPSQHPTQPLPQSS